MPEFKECSTCAAKPGSPQLCDSCLHNRDLVNSLNLKYKALLAIVHALEMGAKVIDDAR